MMEIREHISLAPLVTYRAGGTARYLIDANTPEDVFLVDAFAREKELPLFVLGGGSNTLPPDGEWNGVILRMRIAGISEYTDGERTIIEAGAGLVMDDIVALSITRGLHGLENLSWVPGTVGAAPIQNIGCYGVEVSSFIEWVEVADLKQRVIRRLTRDACQFRYRETIFKTPEGKHLVVLRVAFTLPQVANARIGYKDTTGQYRDLAGYFEGRDSETITPAEIRIALAKIRGAKFSTLSGEGTAGSFFKNPIVPKSLAEDLQMRYPKLPLYPTEDPLRIKLPAGFLIDHIAGMRGYRDGCVGVSPLHALAIVNYGGATSKAIRAMAEMVITRVQEKTGIIISPEVMMIDEK